jgi:hypothetical protein
MKNYNFESRSMSLEEKELLENKLKIQRQGRKTSIISVFILIIVGYFFLYPYKLNDIFVKFNVSFVSSILAVIPIIIVLLMIFNYLNKKIYLDLKTGLTFLATAKLEDFMDSEDEDDIGFHYLYVNEVRTVHIDFYFQGESIIKLKSFVNPVKFADVDKYVLRKSLKKGTFYTLAFSLNSDFLFSIEEI